MNKRACLNATFLFVVASLALSSVALGDLASLAEDCDDCHGKDGVSEWSDVPTIAGISAYAHSDALFIFLDRARPCVSSEYRRGDTSREETDMCETVDDLTEDEIEEIGEYYAAKPFVPAKQEFDAEKAAVGKELSTIANVKNAILTAAPIPKRTPASSPVNGRNICSKVSMPTCRAIEINRKR